MYATFLGLTIYSQPCKSPAVLCYLHFIIFAAVQRLLKKLVVCEGKRPAGNFSMILNLF
jgi:hypothetical protein